MDKRGIRSFNLPFLFIMGYANSWLTVYGFRSVRFLCAVGTVANRFEQIVASGGQCVRGNDPKDVLAQPRADHRKFRVSFDNGLGNFSRGLALQVLIGNDNHGGLRFKQSLTNIRVA